MSRGPSTVIPVMLCALAVACHGQLQQDAPATLGDGATDATSDARSGARDDGDSRPPNDAGSGPSSTDSSTGDAATAGDTGGPPADSATADADASDATGADSGATNDAGAMAPPCPEAPTGANAHQAEALQRLHDVRDAMGVPCAIMIPEINEASQNHADYGGTHGFDPICAADPHVEVPECDEFTGENYWDRMAATGYAGYAWTEIIAFGTTGEAFDAWLHTLWHRGPLIHPNTRDLGYGEAPSYNVMDFGQTQAVAADVWFYPPEGATVPPLGRNEVPAPPAPPAGCETWGMFVSVAFAQGVTVQVGSHELVGPSGPAAHQWIRPEDTELLLGSLYAMIPCPLEAGATYTIHVTGTLDGAPFDRTSSFHTQ